MIVILQAKTLDTNRKKSPPIMICDSLNAIHPILNFQQNLEVTTRFCFPSENEMIYSTTFQYDHEK